MAKKQEQPDGLQSLKQAIRAKNPGNLYFFYGEEIFLLQHYLQQLRKGDFVCGSVGIRMCIGETTTGGQCPFGGQKLIPECVQKITDVRKWITQKGLEVDVEVDGGMNVANVHSIIAAGANVIVAGSAVFKDDIAKNVEAFLQEMNKK